MIDLQKLKERFDRKMREAELSNAVEKEVELTPTVFSLNGRVHVCFTVTSDREAGRVLDAVRATETHETFKGHDTWHLCKVCFSVGDITPYLKIEWTSDGKEFSLKLDDVTKSCVFNDFVHRHGQRKVNDIEAESGFMIRRFGKANYSYMIDEFAFDGYNTEYQGGTTLSEEPAICNGICVAFVEKWNEGDQP